MSEIRRKPTKFVIDDIEYAAFDENHSWGDIARWIKSHGECDIDEFLRCFGSASGTSGSAQDAQRLDPKGAGPTRAAGDAQHG
jgi:hypothetical protein